MADQFPRSVAYFDSRNQADFVVAPLAPDGHCLGDSTTELISRLQLCYYLLDYFVSAFGIADDAVAAVAAAGGIVAVEP